MEDERSFRHVGLYAELKRALVEQNAHFAVVDRPDDATLLNLAFWRPGGVAEVLPDDVITADQVAHSAWHFVAASQLGDASRTAPGLLMAEAIASAFDVFLVGRLLGHAPSSQFLATQVPAMADAAAAAGLDDAGFEALLARASEEPDAMFEALRQLLFDTSMQLLRADGIEEAAGVLDKAAAHELGPLLHHYELPSWLLFARAHGTAADSPEVTALDATLRAAPSSLDWLEKNWF